MISLPKRSRRFGIGKEIGGAVYLHRDYEHLLGEPVVRAQDRLLRAAPGIGCELPEELMTSVPPERIGCGRVLDL
jgi:hypothetical protein